MGTLAIYRCLAKLTPKFKQLHITIMFSASIDQKSGPGLAGWLELKGLHKMYTVLPLFQAPCGEGPVWSSHRSHSFRQVIG